MPFSCARTDLFHQNLAVLQGRRVAGIDDARAVEAVGAVEGYAEVVARLTVDGPAGLQGQRGPAREAQEGRRQVLDLVGVFASHEAGADPTAASLRTELGVGCAAHALDGGFAH